MKLRKVKFATQDSGAVTVDWVVLCAAVVGLAALTVAQFTSSAVKVGDKISTAVTN